MLDVVRTRRELPEVGELVVGTVVEIFEHGAYVTLDEYNNLKAFLPRGEVSSRWVRNIRDYLREGRKAVFKVIRVNRAKKHVDISLRRVSDAERKNKLILWKRAQKAEKILELAAIRLGKTLDDAYNEAGWRLEDKYGEIYAGFEEAALRGIEALLEAGVPEEWCRVLKELIDKHIEIRKVKVSGEVRLQTLASDGVKRIRDILVKAKSIKLPANASLRIYTVGSPRYRVDIETEDYKTAESILANVFKVVEEEARKLKVIASCRRLERR